jgi:hypothetical protein
MSARYRLQAARRVESTPSLMKKDLDHNSADPAEIEALITRLERGQLREVDSANGRRRITPTEVSGRVPKLLGNRLAHVFPIRSPVFKASLEFEPTLSRWGEVLAISETGRFTIGRFI